VRWRRTTLRMTTQRRTTQRRTTLKAVQWRLQKMTTTVMLKAVQQRHQTMLECGWCHRVALQGRSKQPL
jgi:hypothetical protein